MFCISLFRYTQLTHPNHNIESRYAGSHTPNDASLNAQTLKHNSLTILRSKGKDDMRTGRAFQLHIRVPPNVLHIQQEEFETCSGPTRVTNPKPITLVLPTISEHP